MKNKMETLLNKTQLDILANLENNSHGLFTKAKSFYIHGKTGCGKTTILETFVSEHCTKKKILFMHFHDYLLDVTKLMHKNPLRKIVKAIAKRVDYLCFDEFFIESIADAKILYDIYSELINAGVSIVLTSNFSPDELYKDGFNREIMFPLFSDFLKNKMEICHIKNIPDYRTTSNFTEFQTFFHTVEEFEEKFDAVIVNREEEIFVDDNHTISIAGRFFHGCVLDYHSFFKRPTSIKDYRKLARTFLHIHVKNMQKFFPNNEDEAIRFRNFIDILYARGIVFSCSGLRSYGGNHNVFDAQMLENIKFKRCESRLTEMETSEYIYAHNKEVKRNMTIASANFFDDISVRL